MAELGWFFQQAGPLGTAAVLLCIFIVFKGMSNGGNSGGGGSSGGGSGS